MATDGRSLRRRNRWAALIAATGMCASGVAILHLDLLRMNRARQRAVLDSSAKMLESALAAGLLTPESAKLTSPGALWAAGISPELPRLAHPGFSDLQPNLSWPLTSGQLASARLPDGRTFRLLMVDASQRPAGLRLYLALDTTQETDAERRMMIQRAATVLIVALLSFVVADLIFRQVMRPIEDLAKKAASIRAKELGQRLSPSDFPVELQGLITSLNETIARMQDAFERMEHLSTDLAHELRSPIQNLRSELEGMLLHPQTEAERGESMGSALEELDRLGAMIEQMLFLARCEDPGSELRVGPLPVPILLQEIADYFEASADTAGVTLAVEAQPISLFADRALIQRALGNLISNALRHTPEGGRITLRGRVESDRVLLEVEDTGEGIPAEVLPRLGTRFTRVEDSRARTTGGTGLGIAIVKGIMRLHGGTLEFNSELGKGTLARLGFRLDPTGRSRNEARAPA